MKMIQRRLLVLCGICVLLSACENPWVKRKADVLFEEKNKPGGENPGPAGPDPNAVKLAKQGDLLLITDNLSGSYVLTSDITVSGTWTPLGASSTTRFTGTFDGNGHTITMAATIQAGPSSTAYGLFGYIGSGGEVKNLKITGSINYTRSGNTYFGPITGTNYGTIRNVASGVNIVLEDTSIRSHAGGIVGVNYGTIVNCYSTGNIRSTGSSTTTSYSDRWVSSGGIVGVSDSGSVSYCWVSGTISASVSVSTTLSAAAGGIAGSSGDTVSNCVALNTSVTATTQGGTAYVGRVIGENLGTSTGNYANSAMTVQATAGSGPGTVNTDGTSINSYSSQTWWTGTVGWTINSAGAGNRNSPWEWNTSTSRPKLWFE